MVAKQVLTAGKKGLAALGKPKLPSLASILAGNSTLQAYAAQGQSLAARAKPAALWAAPAGVFVLWMISPALTDNFRNSLGLPSTKEAVPSQIKYTSEEIDTMPTVKK